MQQDINRRALFTVTERLCHDWLVIDRLPEMKANLARVNPVLDRVLGAHVKGERRAWVHSFGALVHDSDRQ